MHQIHQGKEAEGKPDLHEKCLKQAKMKAQSGSLSQQLIYREDISQARSNWVGEASLSPKLEMGNGPVQWGRRG